jgi:hypothetical protein
MANMRVERFIGGRLAHGADAIRMNNTSETEQLWAIQSNRIETKSFNCRSTLSSYFLVMMSPSCIMIANSAYAYGSQGY